MNVGVDLKTANKLVVPGGSIRLTSWRRATSNPTDSAAAPSLTKIRARKGDTIAKIAAAYKLSADELARLNGIAPNLELQAGQEIRLPGSTSSTAAPANSRRR